MSLTYDQYVSTLAGMVPIASDNTDFQTMLPSAIDYAEGRCYRDLDMLALQVRDSSASTSANDRNFTLPTSVGTFQVVEEISIVTPAGTAPDSGGTRNVLTPASQSVVDYFWPNSTGAGVPQFFAYVSQSSISGQKNIIFGPWPSAAYRVEVTGQIQWTPLSSSNTTTFLSLYYPDLFVAASMVFLSGWMKDFGGQSDDPKMATSWESQYTTLLGGASPLEARKRMAGASWTAKPVEPTAVPQRG
jgi:hypothetical protein